MIGLYHMVTTLPYRIIGDNHRRGDFIETIFSIRLMDRIGCISQRGTTGIKEQLASESVLLYYTLAHKYGIQITYVHL